MASGPEPAAAWAANMRLISGRGDEQADQQRGDAHDRGFDDLEPVGAVQAQQRLGRGRAGGVIHAGELPCW